jgi:hypothetical protein
MTTTRMLPLAGGRTGFSGSPEPAGSGAAPGRSYSATPGQVIDAAGDPVNGDATTLVSQGWLQICASGTTAQRPQGCGWCGPGTLYLDTTLNQVLVWDSQNWRNVVTGAAA